MISCPLLAGASAGEAFVPSVSGKPGCSISEFDLKRKLAKKQQTDVLPPATIKDPQLDICVHAKVFAVDIETDARPSWIFCKTEDL